jgi:hypothetical protein
VPDWAVVANLGPATVREHSTEPCQSQGLDIDALQWLEDDCSLYDAMKNMNDLQSDGVKSQKECQGVLRGIANVGGGERNWPISPQDHRLRPVVATRFALFFIRLARYPLL